MSIDIMKADLPDMPDEVIDGWLATHYNRFGWPPRVDNEWRYVLRPGNDLSYLQGLKWQKEAMHLPPQALSPKDLQIVTDLYETHVLNRQTFYTMMMSDGRERFTRCCEYLKEHGTFPHPVILQRRTEGFWILDGNHRLTAYFHLYGYFNVGSPESFNLAVKQQQEFWVAS